MARVLRRPGEPELNEGMRLLDRYTILDRIGSGGMATIYRATDDRLDRVVCIKLLRTTLVGAAAAPNGRAVYEATYTHFLKEALALSKLSHANTLRIYDFGYVDDGRGGQGAPFHVSEYLDGGNLETHVRKHGPLPADEAIGILEGVGDALAEAHEHGILHRDIKPSNILFARIRGELVPKLADFGIARSNVEKTDDGPSSGAPASSVALFSPRWAAPEQLCGASEGPRTDVYALALLTVFALSGTVLFADEDVRLTFNDRVRGDDLVNGRLQALGFPRDLAGVLERAMLARPEARTATAPEFTRALREVLEVKPARSVLPIPVTSLAGPAEERSRVHSVSELEIEIESSGRVAHAPVEHVVTQGERVVRYVRVHEKLDLSFLDETEGPVRLRVTLLPGPSHTVNVKGLTCFVARRGGRPTPALTANVDGTIELVSAGRQVLGELTWSFGQKAATGRVFLVDGKELLVPYGEAQRAIALALSSVRDIVMMCQR